MQSTIFIIGAGAIGKVLAVSLALENKKVILIRGSVDHQPARKEKIHVRLNDQTELAAEIEISTFSQFPVLDGIIVLTNKSYGNEELTKILKPRVKDSPLVLLQNGLGVEQTFLDNDFQGIYRCVLFATSQPISENQLKFKPVAVSPIGIIKGTPTELEKLVAQVNSTHFPFRAEADIQPIIWKKAITNCVFNSICPLLETDNGIFHREPGVLALAKQVIEECTAIAREKGIFLQAQEVLDSLLLISKSSDGQLISTFQDIKNKRRTEIETLNFEIARIAATLHKEDNVKQTRILGELVKWKSDLSR